MLGMVANGTTNIFAAQTEASILGFVEIFGL